VIEDINKKIGRKIAEYRKVSGLSQETLAAKSGVTTEYISRLERGVNSPSVKTLNSLSDPLSVSIKDFFLFAEEENDDWELSFDALVVLMKNKKGKTIQKLLKLAEVEDE